MRALRPTWHLVLFIPLLLALTSCGTLIPRPMPTPFPTFTPAPTWTPSPLPPSPTASPTPLPALPRAVYQLDTVFDYDRHTVSVAETILYPNRTGQALAKLVLAVVPNLWAGCFTMTSVAVSGQPVTDFTVDGQRMELSLPAPLGPEEVTTLNIAYTLALPFAEQQDPNVSRPRIFGYTKAQTNLANWYPFVVPFINGDWVLHEPWYYGEHLVYDAADFVVDLHFTGAEDPPVVASSGAYEPLPGGLPTETPGPFVDARYTLTGGRAFALSMSREVQVATQQYGDVTVSSYYFPFNANGGRAALETAGQALQLYSQRFGPYPHKTLSVVMGDFNDGMEYSAFFFLSRDFYNLYTNAPSAVNYLVFVAAHETSHQWWFEQVANDQAQYPWLDEALATYSERLFYEAYYPDLVKGWWQYRIDFYQPQGFVDIPIYEGQGFRPYTNAVYFRGAHFLEDLRTRLGDEIFFGFLQDYLAQERGKIAAPADFFRILAQHTAADYSDLVRQYFQNIY
jgi:hypothetical protein